MSRSRAHWTIRLTVCLVGLVAPALVVTLGWSIVPAAGTDLPHTSTTEPWVPSQAPLPTQLPSDLPSTQDQLNGTSCSSDDFCVSVGGIEDTAQNWYPLAEIYNDGAWTAQVLPAPPNGCPPNIACGKGDQLTSISCPVDGQCTAIGWYLYTQLNASNQYVSNYVGFIESLDAGVWSYVIAPLPGTSIETILGAVTCPDPTTCVVVGTYADGVDPGPIAFVDTGEGATWTSSTLPVSPGMQGLSFDSIECPDDTDCVAVGGSGSGGVIFTLSAGSWSSMVAPLPPNAATTIENNSMLKSVDCVAVGSCVAGGEFADDSGDLMPVIEQLSAGTWTPTEAPQPEDGSAPEQASVLAVTCDSVTCYAVGDYIVGTYTAGESNTVDGMILTESDGTWSAEAAPLPTGPESANSVTSSTSRANATAATFVTLDSASCVADSCVAAGDDNGSGLIETATPGAPSPPETVSSFSPSWGVPAGGTTVAILGDGFTPTSTVSFGSVPATSTTFVDAEELLATTPTHGLGVAAISVSDGGQTYLDASSGFTYATPPSATASKSTGLVGNTVIKLTGSVATANGDTSVTARECATAMPSASNCDPATLATAVLSKTGSFTISSFKVVVGDIDGAGDTCGLVSSPSCVILVVASDSASSEIPLTFASPSVTLAKSVGAVGNAADRVTVSAFPAGDSVTAEECDASVTTATAESDCDAATAVDAKISTSGSAGLTPGVKLRVGTAFGDPAGKTCLPGATCSVFVIDTTNPAIGAGASVTFAQPTISVSPTTVANAKGQVLTVSGLNVPAGDAIAVAECDTAYSAGNALDCDAATLVEGTAGSTGKTTSRVTILTSATTPDYADMSSPRSTCSPNDTVANHDPCYVSLTDTSNPDIAAHASFGVA